MCIKKMQTTLELLWLNYDILFMIFIMHVCVCAKFMTFFITKLHIFIQMIYININLNLYCFLNQLLFSLYFEGATEDKYIIILYYIYYFTLMKT